MENLTKREDEEEIFHECQCGTVEATLDDEHGHQDEFHEFSEPAQHQGSATMFDEFAIDDVHLKELESVMNEEEKEKNHQLALSIKLEGNLAFGESKWEDAAKIYTRALRTCPPSFCGVRAVLYSNRAACFIRMDQDSLAIEDCTKAAEIDPTYAKAFFRRAQLYEKKEEQWDKALEDYQQVYRMQPDNRGALAGIMRLPAMITERNERMKTEMMSKLKDLGNMILRPFGLSTDNFQLEPNAQGGGYSVKMTK